MKAKIFGVTSMALFCSGFAAHAIGADDPNWPLIYSRISTGLRYSTGGRHKDLDPTRGALRIPKDKSLVVVFDFDRIDFGKETTLPAEVCISIRKEEGSATSKPVPLKAGTKLNLNDVGYQASDSAADYVINLGLSPTCGAAVANSTSFVVHPVSGVKPHLSISDAFMIGALTQLAPIRDPNVEDPPNRHFQCCRVGANVFFFPPEAGWFGRSIGLNITGLDFDGKSRPSLGVVVSIPKTDRALFVGWGYHAAATRVQHKGYFFIGTSFIGLKDLFDPGGKVVGNPK